MKLLLLHGVLLSMACVASSVKLTVDTLTFGHSVKNGALPPVNATGGGEVVTFEPDRIHSVRNVSTTSKSMSLHVSSRCIAADRDSL